MPIEWSADPAARRVRIRLSGEIGLDESIALVRGVAMVTNITGGFGMLVDARDLTVPPPYPVIFRCAHEVRRLASRNPDRIAVLTAPMGAIFGKARQFCAALLSLGIIVDHFTDEPSALGWIETTGTDTVA